MQSLTKTNVLFRFKKGWPQLFLNCVSCWKLTRKNVLCWGNCCQFGEQFLTDRIFWATFPKHSQNRCFIPSLHKITTVLRWRYMKFKCKMPNYCFEFLTGIKVLLDTNHIPGKIQNRISEKTRRKIVILSCKNSVKTQFLGVVEFPSIFLISKILSKQNFRE